MTLLAPFDFARSPEQVRRDLAAGLVVAVIALPLSLALAVAVGAPPITGLYTAAFAGFTASFFGGSRFNITGPTAALVPILSQVTLQHGVEALPMVGLMAGIMLVGMSRLKAGGLIRFMPGPVIVGFTVGIALSIAFGQVNSLLGITGVDPDAESFFAKERETLANIDTVHMTTALIGVASLAMLFTWRALPKLGRVPSPLVVVVAMTAICWAGNIESATLGSRFGELPGKFPLPSASFLDLGLVFALLPSAVAVALLASIESLLSAVVADGMVKNSTRHDPDKELFGQGLANLVSPFMGGLPATAAIARTAAGVRSGGTSRLVGMVHAIAILCATLLLGSLASHIPLTVLAAILIYTAWNIAELPELLHLLRRAPRTDLTILLSTVLITLFFDLTYAILFGVIASGALLIHQLIKLPAAKPLLPDETGRVREVSPELSQLMEAHRHIQFFSAQGFLSFHSVARFEYELTADLSRPLVLRMKDVAHIDTTGLLTLDGIIEHRQRHGGRILLSAVQPELNPVLERFGIFEKVGRENVFPETRLAIAALCQHDSGPSRSGAIAGDRPTVLGAFESPPDVLEYGEPHVCPAVVKDATNGHPPGRSHR